MGGIPLQRPQLEEPPQIGRFLLQNTAYYTIVAKITDVNVDTSQVHQKFKPHLVGTVTLDDPDSGEQTHQVWGERGLSPCIRTRNRIMIALGNDVVEIEVEGLAALQEIPLAELPHDLDAARAAIGNGINRRMHEYAVTQAAIYANQFLVQYEGKRDAADPTTDADDEIETPPPTTYKALLSKFTMQKEAKEQEQAPTGESVPTESATKT